MMTTTPNNMKMDKLADFAALAAWVIVCGAMATVAYIQFGQDFRGYYAAAHVLLEGGNPYDYFQVAPVLQEVTGRVGNNPFYYPLWFGWFIAPLALLPYPVARAVWMFLNLAAWMIGLTRLRGLLDFPRKGWRTWSLFLLGTFLFGWMTWKFEQTGILLFALTVESLIAYRDRQWTRMGVLLAAVLIKPNIMLIPVVILSLWLVRKRIYRPVAVMTALLAGLMLVTTLLTPDWYQPLFRPGFGQGLTEVLDGPEKTTGIRLNTTMMDWLKVSGLPDTVSGVLYAAAVVFCILLAARTLWKSESFMEVTIIALLVSFAVTPYALQYDFPPLVIPLFWALAATHPATSKTIPILLTAFITSVLVWERPISDGYWIVIGVALLVAWSMKTPGTFARTNASMA